MPCDKPQVLREHLRCTLPVEVAFRGSAELDAATLGSLAALFPPLRGLDLSAAPQFFHQKRCGGLCRALTAAALLLLSMAPPEQDRFPCGGARAVELRDSPPPCSPAPGAQRGGDGRLGGQDLRAPALHFPKGGGGGTTSVVRLLTWWWPSGCCAAACCACQKRKCPCSAHLAACVPAAVLTPAASHPLAAACL